MQKAFVIEYLKKQKEWQQVNQPKEETTIIKNMNLSKGINPKQLHRPDREKDVRR